MSIKLNELCIIFSFVIIDAPVDVNLLNAVLSYKKILDEIRTNFLGTKSENKSPFESSEEGTLRRAAGDADSRLKNYETYLRSLSKPTAREATKKKGKDDTENGFKNFLNLWERKLPPLFEKAGLKVVS